MQDAWLMWTTDAGCMVDVDAGMQDAYGLCGRDIYWALGLGSV